MRVVLPAPFAPTRPMTSPGLDPQVDLDDAAVPAVGLREPDGLDGGNRPRHGSTVAIRSSAGQAPAAGQRARLGRPTTRARIGPPIAVIIT